MEAKKVEETRSLVQQAAALLRQHLQTSPHAPLRQDERRQLRWLLQMIVPSLAIVRSYDQHHHQQQQQQYYYYQRSVYAITATAMEQVLNCAALCETGNDVEQLRSPHETNEMGHGDGTAMQNPPELMSAEEGPRWADIYGCQDAILALQQATTLPVRYPALFTGPRRPWRRLLLYGPPGTGKTQLASATAVEFNAAFLSVSAADLLSKWVGESEKQVRHAFAQAAAAGPRCVLFFDEVDALCSTRGGQGESELARRLKTEFLLHLQTVAPSVLVLAATNMPWELDAAIVRRFDRFVHVGLPSSGDKIRFVRDELRGVAHALTDAQLSHVVEKTEGYSLVDMRRLVSDAVMAPVTEWLSARATADTSLSGADGEAERNRATNRAARSPDPLSPHVVDDQLPDNNDCEGAFATFTPQLLGETTASGSTESAPTSHILTTRADEKPSSLTQHSHSSSSLDAEDDDEVTRMTLSSPAHIPHINDEVPLVEKKHFEDALRRVVATTSASEAARYTQWSSQTT